MERMNLAKRVVPFLMVGICVMAVEYGVVPTEGASMVQVESRGSDGRNRREVCYDVEDMAMLEMWKVERISLKSRSGEEVLEEMSAWKVLEEEVEGRVVEYWYSPRLEKYRIVRGQKCNLQVSMVGEEMAIGYPMLDVGF